MTMGRAQLICLVAGVMLLSLGGGLVGGRWAVQRQGVSMAQRPDKAPSPLEKGEAQEPAAVTTGGKKAPGEAYFRKATTEGQSSQLYQAPPPAKETERRETAPAGGRRSQRAPTKFVIQAISTSDRNDARLARKKIMAEGLAAGIFEIDLGGKGRWYRVYVGPYDTEAEAKAALGPVQDIPGFETSFVKSLE